MTLTTLRLFVVTLSLLLIPVISEAQWRALEIPEYPRDVVAIGDDRFLVLSWVRYEDIVPPGVVFTAHGSVLNRVGFNHPTKQLLWRSNVLHQYEPGTDPVSLDVVGRTGFLVMSDITDTYSTEFMCHFDVDADTVLITDTFDIEQICNERSARVVRNVSWNNPTTLRGTYDLSSATFTQEEPTQTLEARNGLVSIVSDPQGAVAYVNGCGADSVLMYVRDSLDYWFSVDRYHNVHRKPRLSRYPLPSGWSYDQGKTWQSYPVDTTMGWRFLLADRTWIGQTRSDASGRSQIAFYDSTLGRYRDIRQLPDSVWIIHAIGENLQNVTLAFGGWPFESDRRGYAIVQTDLSTSVEEDRNVGFDPFADDRADRWTLYDLLGSTVASGVGEPDLSVLGSGMYLLRQGRKITKIIR